MAFTREFIRQLAKESDVQLPKELIDGLIAEHTSSRDAFAEEQVKKAQEAATPEKVEDSEPYKKLKKDFDDYKTETENKATRAAKEKAFRELLKSAGISEKRIDTVMKVSDIDGVELSKDGKIKDADKRVETIKTEWADFVETVQTKGAPTANPPANTGSGTGVTKESILAIKDGATRRQAMAENPQLFGLAEPGK